MTIHVKTSYVASPTYSWTYLVPSTKNLSPMPHGHYAKEGIPSTFNSPMALLPLNKLNPSQKEAVLHGNGPLLILAGAGSGKTSTMAYRIAHLIAIRRIPATQILGLSFTKKAADELKSRVRGLVTQAAGPTASRGLTISTFHSLCARLLRNYASQAGLQANFTILDSNDQVEVVRQILKNIHVDDKQFDPAMLLFEIGQTKNRFLSPAEAEAALLNGSKLPGEYADIAATVYRKYHEHLRATISVDFDDLIYLTVKLLEENPTVRDECNDRFRYLLVDEYQDTNPAQFRLLRGLTHFQQNLCVVGDDDQSIYGWRGADSTHILKFSSQFEGARVITLDQNYRSTSTILDAANEVIAKNTHRHPKRLWSDKGRGEPIEMVIVEEDRAEAEVVAEEILKRARTQHEGVTTQLRPWKDFALLYRSNPQSRLFEEALRMRQIPYKIVGTLSFLDRKEIKDLLAYWRLIINPNDDAAFRRVINWPSRGIGKGTLEALNQKTLDEKKTLIQVAARASSFLPRAATAVEGFATMIHAIRRDLDQTPVEPTALANWAKRSLEKIDMRRGLEEDSKDPAHAARKWDNLDELCNAVGQVPLEEIMEDNAAARTPDGGFPAVIILREFIARMTLNALEEEEDKKKDQKDRQRDEVTLLTLHGAKGLEFPIVFMVGLEEGLLPHKRTIEEGLDFSEERRLCYVGITRAKERLIMTRARNRIRYGKTVPRTPSRFLADIPSELMITRDESYSPDPDSPDSQAKHEAKVKDFLSQIRAQLQGPKTLGR